MTAIQTPGTASTKRAPGLMAINRFDQKFQLVLNLPSALSYFDFVVLYLIIAGYLATMPAALPNRNHLNLDRSRGARPMHLQPQRQEPPPPSDNETCSNTCAERPTSFAFPLVISSFPATKASRRPRFQLNAGHQLQNVESSPPLHPLNTTGPRGRYSFQAIRDSSMVSGVHIPIQYYQLCFLLLKRLRPLAVLLKTLSPT